MKRKIVRIEADKCTGGGLCIDACHEGALKLVDGKAQLVSESQCDGLGACLPQCPADAIRIETREAAAFGPTAPGSAPSDPRSQKAASGGNEPMRASGCPGAQAMDFRQDAPAAVEATGPVASQLRQWPIQLHLINPTAP